MKFSDCNYFLLCRDSDSNKFINQQLLIHGDFFLDGLQSKGERKRTLGNLKGNKINSRKCICLQELECRTTIPSYMIRIKRWKLLHIRKIHAYSLTNVMPWEHIDFLHFQITQHTSLIGSSSHLYDL